MSPATSPPLDIRMLKFIRQHHIFTLATTGDGLPWCSSCFYVFTEEPYQFIFTSDLKTLHAQQMLLQERVAGAIALESKIVGLIRGLQFTGKAALLGEDPYEFARNAYIKRFPVAMLMDTTLWSLKPDRMKMTDNRLGFGKKLYWPQE